LWPLVEPPWVGEGRLTPFFLRHSRIAGNRGLPVARAPGLGEGVVDVLEAPDVEVAVPAAPVAVAALEAAALVDFAEEPPQALRPRHARVRTAIAAAAGRPAFAVEGRWTSSMMGIELLVR